MTVPRVPHAAQSTPSTLTRGKDFFGDGDHSTSDNGSGFGKASSRTIEDRNLPGRRCDEEEEDGGVSATTSRGVLRDDLDTEGEDESNAGAGPEEDDVFTGVSRGSLREKPDVEEGSGSFVVSEEDFRLCLLERHMSAHEDLVFGVGSTTFSCETRVAGVGFELEDAVAELEEEAAAA